VAIIERTDKLVRLTARDETTVHKINHEFTVVQLRQWNDRFFAARSRNEKSKVLHQAVSELITQAIGTHGSAGSRVNTNDHRQAIAHEAADLWEHQASLQVTILTSFMILLTQQLSHPGSIPAQRRTVVNQVMSIIEYQEAAHFENCEAELFSFRRAVQDLVAELRPFDYLRVGRVLNFLTLRSLKREYS